MSIATASMVSLGVAAAFGLGIAVGPRIDRSTEAVASVVETPVAAAAPSAPATAAPVRAARLERVPTASAKPVQKHVKQLLNRGTDVEKAAEGFPNAYQLMTVAYAARNTDIPFVVLKHRVLTEGKPLATAIGELKPELDVTAEANRARAEARADLARLSNSN